ncbi:hypothetical protein FJ366_01625 [Candidatus Dependentiae bacterium]|nr:hypothetical protein [Candidatus Dependentiae bacterium]
MVFFFAVACAAACVVQVYKKNVNPEGLTQECAEVGMGGGAEKSCEPESAQAVSLDMEKLIHAIVGEYHKTFSPRYYTVATIHFNGVHDEQTRVCNLVDKAAVVCAVSDIAALDDVSSIDSKYVPRFLSAFPEGTAGYKTFFLIISEGILKDRRFVAAFSAVVMSCRGLQSLIIVPENYHNPVAEEVLLDLASDNFCDIYRNSFFVDQYAFQNGLPVLIRDGFKGLAQHTRKIFNLDCTSAVSAEERFAQAYFNKALARRVTGGSQQYIAVKLAKTCNMTVSWNEVGEYEQPDSGSQRQPSYCCYVSKNGNISRYNLYEERHAYYASAPENEIVCFLDSHSMTFKFNRDTLLTGDFSSEPSTFEGLVALCKEAIEKKQMIDGVKKFTDEEENLAVTYTMQQLFKDLKVKVGREFAVVRCDDKEKIAGIKPRGGKLTIVVLTSGEWQTLEEGQKIHRSRDTLRDFDIPYYKDRTYKNANQKIIVLDREDYLEYNFWSRPEKYAEFPTYHVRERIFTKDIKRVPKTKEAFLDEVIKRARNTAKYFSK